MSGKGSGLNLGFQWGRVTMVHGNRIDACQAADRPLEAGMSLWGIGKDSPYVECLPGPRVGDGETVLLHQSSLGITGSQLGWNMGTQGRIRHALLLREGWGIGEGRRGHYRLGRQWGLLLVG